MKFEHGTEVDVYFPLEKWESGHVVVGEGMAGEVLTQRQDGRQTWLVHSFKPENVRKRVEVLTELPEGCVLMRRDCITEAEYVIIDAGLGDGWSAVADHDGPSLPSTAYVLVESASRRDA